MNGPVQARRMLVTVLAVLVVAGLPVTQAVARQLPVAARACMGSQVTKEVLASSATVRVTQVEMLRVTRAASGFTADARVRRQGTAMASVEVTADLCPDGVSYPVTVTRRLNWAVSRKATVRNRVAASRAAAEDLALADAKAKARDRMRKALIVAAMRQASDEAAEVSSSGP
jgi:hypothetical protein